MKQILFVFGSIAMTLFGLILIYANLSQLFDLQGQILAFFGVLLLSAGITGLWMRNRFGKS